MYCRRRSDTCSSAAANGNLSALSGVRSGSALMADARQRRDDAVDDADVLGPLDGGGIERAYRTNLAKGQTGLSIAFDLPTQTGYDPDSEWARGEVGKVGVPVAHLGHMRTLLDGIPPGEMNTSMTINATASWLLALYVVNAEQQGVDSRALRGTTQNDIVKEYLSRGTYIFPPEPSRRLIVDMVAWCSEHAPLWNPTNVCSYHLQEAGATPVQEIAYAMATAIGVLDAVRDSGQVAGRPFRRRVRVDLVLRQRRHPVRGGDLQAAGDGRAVGPDRPRALRRRPTNAPAASATACRSTRSGLTEAQPENNVQRIVLEMLGVTLSKRARARSIQLPAWNEALGLPTSMGSAVVVADATGAGIRDRPARVRRPVRRLDGRRGRARPSCATPRRPSSTTCWRWAGRSRRSTCSSHGWWRRWPNARAGSRPAIRPWSVSTPSPSGAVTARR